MTIVVLTPLPVEYQAVRRYLGNVKDDLKGNILYNSGHFDGLYHPCDIILRQTGPNNTVIALAAEKAVAQFKPQLIFLTGIAAGVKDVKIGDVVVATKAYGYESSKITAAGARSRPNVQPYSALLQQWATRIDRANRWRARTSDGAADASVIFGPIASGDKVIATTDSDLFRYLKEHYDDTTALEMEAIGFALAMAGHPEIQALNIRGISDLMDHKSDQFQQLAAERAAAFLFELLYQIDLGNLIEKPSAESQRPTIQVKDTKNAVIGSQITAGGDVHIGDKYIVSGKDVTAPDHDDPAAVAAIQALIAKGQLEQAIRQLKELAQRQRPELVNEVVLYADRFSQLSRKIRMGTLSNTDATLERNQIVVGVLEMLGTWRE